MGNTLVKKSLLGVRLRTRFQRDPESAGGGGGENGDKGAGASTGDDGDESAGDDEEEKKDEEESSSEKTVSESKYLQIKRQLSEADRKKQAALEELKALKEKDLPDAEKQARDLKEAQESAAAYQVKFQNLARTNAFLTASSDLKISWVKVESALKLAELDDLEINEDGSVDGIKDAVKALAKDHPYLLAPKDSEEGNNGKGATKSGSVVGSKNTGKKPEGEISEDELKKRFPALNR